MERLIAIKNVFLFLFSFFIPFTYGRSDHLVLVDELGGGKVRGTDPPLGSPKSHTEKNFSQRKNSALHLS